MDRAEIITLLIVVALIFGLGVATGSCMHTVGYPTIDVHWSRGK